MSDPIRTPPGDLYIKVGENIARFRKEISLSQVDLAKKVGITQPHLASIEGGNRRISLEDLIKVCQALHITTNQVLPETGGPKKPGPRPKLAVAYEKLLTLQEKDQSAILAMIDSLAEKTPPKP